MAFCAHMYMISHMTYEDFLPCIEKWYTPKIPHNNPPPPMYVLSPQHSVKVFRRYDFDIFLVLLIFKDPKIAAPQNALFPKSENGKNGKKTTSFRFNSEPHLFYLSLKLVSPFS